MNDNQRRALNIATSLQDALFIGGGWSPAHSDEQITTINPATGEPIRDLTAASAADVDLAVAAARRALPTWARTPGRERARILDAIADRIDERADQLALLDTLDNGKPFRLSRGVDIVQSAGHMRHQAALAQIDRTEHRETHDSAARIVREPVGVVGLITPWNYPTLMIARAVAPILAAGNTVVIKPSEQTPLSALLFAVIVAEAGVPEGVVNIVTGTGPVAGAALAGHPDIDMITFTGGHKTAQTIAAATTARTTFELGGKAPFIVFADADLDAAVTSATIGAYGNQGQNCMAAARILVEDTIADEFLERFTEATSRVRVGNGFETTTDCGPLISPAHRTRVASFVDTAVTDGAALLTGGGSTGHADFAPALLRDVPERSAAWTDEIFGPVAVSRSFTGTDEGIRLANATRYGLAASVWTRDRGRADDVARALRAGVVWKNTYSKFDAAIPFSPRRASGTGVVGSVHAFDTYTALKSVWEPLETAEVLSS